MAKKEPKEGERLKLDTDWETAAEKLLRTPPKSAPKREVKPRMKKPGKGKSV